MRGLILILTLLSLPAWAEPIAGTPPLPPFTAERPEQWFNSPPLRHEDLIGKVLLIDVWTFDCWNCYRSFPWLHQVEAQFADKPFQVIGIHSPEFDREKDAKQVAAKIAEFKLTHPVMMDNDFAYWRALHNRYWPAFYLVDKQGRLRFVHVGETHAGDANATQIENEINRLLAQ
jgi:thiol-disulfide isomerase/thioredoxin